MESLGNKLKTAREAKDYTIEYVSQETNIASRYLQALEQENLDVFPGEPYIQGFLKNYSIYLDLDPNELLSLYRALKIQEQPVPVDDLIRSPSYALKIFGIIAGALIAVGLIGGAIWFFAPRFKKPLVVNPPVRTPVEYTLTAGFLERRFYQEDTVLVSLGTDTHKLEISGLGDTVTVTAPSGLIRLDLSQEASVDLNSDGFSELRVIVADFSKNNSTAGALIRFELEAPKGVELPTVVSAEGFNSSALGNIVIFTSPNPYPFTLQAVFQGYCLFRWEILLEPNRPGRTEQYFQQSEELNIQAQNGIRIGLSNALAVKLQVLGGSRTIPLELGGAGEVVVADLRWIRDDETHYRLVLARLE